MEIGWMRGGSNGLLKGISVPTLAAIGKVKAIAHRARKEGFFTAWQHLAPARANVPVLPDLRSSIRQRFVPSRYNARATGSDGRLILWNTLSGAVSVIPPELRPMAVARLRRNGLAAPLDEAGEYLARHGYLVPHDVDELEKFRHRYEQDQWRTDVLQLMLLASEDCNFRCTYCYQKFKHGTMAPAVRQGVRALILARAPALKELDLAWFGGEPLYGWEAVRELAPFCKDVADRHGIRFSSNMTTNGYLLDEMRATQLLAWGCRSFQVTLDGLREEHDAKRVGRDGKGSYDVILQNLRALRSRKDDLKVTLRVNFDHANAPQLAPFLDVLSGDFAGDSRFELAFRAVQKWGGPNDHQLATCGIGDRRKIRRELERRAQAAGLYQEGGIDNVVQPGGQVCYAARPYHFVIGATGKVMKCTVALDNLEANVVGHLNTDGSMQLNDEHMRQWVSPQFEGDPLCQKCHVLPTCQGAACPLTYIAEGKRTCCDLRTNLNPEMQFTLVRIANSAPQTTASPTIGRGAPTRRDLVSLPA